MSSPRLGAPNASLWIAVCLALATIPMGCGFQSGACVHGGNRFFCDDDSLDDCQEFWCEEGEWEYCSFFEGLSCDEVGFEGEVVLDSFDEPQEPTWTQGGSSSSGGSSGSSSGACAMFSGSLGRVVCQPNSSAGGCSGGKFLGRGTTCAGFSCTSKTNPSTCTTSGGSTGGSSGGASSSCSSAWTCPYDGQASPMCSWACTKSGSERSQTCQVLASMMDDGNAGSCCPICR